MRKPQPWSAADATHAINRIAKSPQLKVSYTLHAKDRLAERDLLLGDALYVLKNGFVFQEAEESTQAGLFKYKIESRTPNSNSRVVRAIAIPDEPSCQIKIVTVMWADE
jgi:hypothetical protein